MQANQAPVIWTAIICTLVLLVAGFLVVGGIKRDISEISDVPTAGEIAALISVPDAPTAVEIAAEMGTLDSAKLDKVCELTEGCEYWEMDYDQLEFSNHDLEDAGEDFYEAISDLVDMDEDYLEISFFDIMDTQVRAYGDEPENQEDADWEVKVFAKVKYHDEDDDEDDADRVYVLITSVLDEGEYDKLSIEEVPRTFEF